MLSILPLLKFFSGLDIIGTYVLKLNPTPDLFTGHLEWWGKNFQYSSFTTQLFWVYNQAIPAWIITVLILRQETNRYLILLVALSMLNSTLPFIGLIPIALVKGVAITCKARKSVKERFIFLVKDLFTFENIICGGFVALISYLYLKANNAAAHIQFLSFTSRKMILCYALSYLLEVGIYLLLVYKSKKRNHYFGQLQYGLQYVL